jgi:hypothetical protein
VAETEAHPAPVCRSGAVSPARQAPPRRTRHPDAVSLGGRCRDRRRARNGVLAVALIVLAGACSAGSSAKSTQPPTSASIPSPSSFLPPPDAATVTPNTQDVDAALASNTNVRDGGLGSLCWARWEVARHLLRATVSPSDAALALRDLEGQLGEVKQEAQSELNLNLRGFADRLASDVDRARDVLTRTAAPDDRIKELSAVFAFEQYPGAADYSTAASPNPHCTRP